jgi:hypothetical protein
MGDQNQGLANVRQVFCHGATSKNVLDFESGFYFAAQAALNL